MLHYPWLPEQSWVCLHWKCITKADMYGTKGFSLKTNSYCCWRRYIMLETLNSDRVLNIDSRVIHNYKPFNRNKLIILHNGCIQNTAKMVKKNYCLSVSHAPGFPKQPSGPSLSCKARCFPADCLIRGRHSCSPRQLMGGVNWTELFTSSNRTQTTPKQSFYVALTQLWACNAT